jgi:RimJ/RimL family protein N-acetyltransferase
MNVTLWVLNAADVQRIYLTVNKRNTSSIEAYLRLGFSREGSQVADIGHGFVMDDYVMGRRLRPG